MSILKNVIKGKLEKPYLILTYGVDGVGKTSFAADFPNPIFLGTEDGSSYLDVARFPKPQTYKDIKESIYALINEDHNYKTLIIDSLDWIEPIIYQSVCELDGAKSIEHAQGGYGKGYVMSIKFWKELIDALKELREKKHMNIIAIAHSHVKSFNDPTQESGYDRYMLKLNDKAAALWREFVDCVFFLNFEISTRINDKNKTIAYGGEKRMVYTQRTAAYDAKDRLGLPESFVLEKHNSFKKFDEIVKALDPKNVDITKKSIQEMLIDIKDEELKKKVIVSIEKANNDPQILLKIEEKVKQITKKGE